MMHEYLGGKTVNNKLFSATALNRRTFIKTLKTAIKSDANCLKISNAVSGWTSD